MTRLEAAAAVRGEAAHDAPGLGVTARGLVHIYRLEGYDVAALDGARQAGTTVVVVTHDPEVGGRMGRTVTIRDGRVGAEGRRGEDYAIVGRDGTVHLPADVLKLVPPGTLLGVEPQADGTVLLIPAAES